ncbi:hypothetical protein ABB37_06357 [Leptomonas pyrrhocoris]|uniref:Uncharacterized protein n=1 Tax=Leptomonas pyrrhocoris TaxID=157538 RepID=A0A0N0DTZ7_LEPPY|nr:hypothetical protein ABB37_06357 [Leptomonas pyrrhocoris]KPA78191.1 hypothetical protein ABB37_06357 [Leptomonas pyrrhocoris]|eukprot:XP_015656630.1 hypothetical protein ABB37_06357 [Leptomonas pyrrhocoris]
MSAIASFALECARSGRWVRGLMALQEHTNSTEAATRHACVAVAQLAAAHSWEAALCILRPMDTVRHTQEVCKTIDTVARHPQLPIDVFEDTIGAMLRALEEKVSRVNNETAEISHSTPSFTSTITPSPPSTSPSLSSTAQLQRRLFLSATQWCSWETATRLLSSLPSPPPRACAERVHALRALRHSLLHDVGSFAQWAGTEEGKGHIHHQSKSTSPSPLLDEPMSSVEEKLQQLEAIPAGAQHHRYSARDRRELARLRELQRQALLQRAQAEEAVLVQQAFTAVAPSAVSVCAALRALSRPPSATVSTSQNEYLKRMETVLSLVQASRLTPELALLYARAVGLVCPQRWAEALAVLDRVEVRRQDTHNQTSAVLQKQTNLWLMSRGSWEAALRELHDWSGSSTTGAATSMQIALDTVRRTALPAHLLYRLHPQHARPWYRLPAHPDEPVARQIAVALARGLRLDEVQLSAAGREWAAQGKWENALQLYYRFPLSEFQKYAARSLVTARPALPTNNPAEKANKRSTMKHLSTDVRDTQAFDVVTALHLLVPEGGIRYTATSPSRPAPPLDVFPACLLIDAAPGWEAALRVFRGCIRSGTKCSPHLLSALLHHTDFPPKELCQVLASYPAAINDGVRRRAKEVFGVEVP